MTYKAAGHPFDVIGMVLDTEHVREIEKKYDCKLVGYSANWKDNFRTYVFDKSLNQWRGVYPLTAEDLQSFTTNQRKKES